MTKIAILQCADTGPLESLVLMLRSVGYECRIPDSRLRGVLRDLGCDTVLDIKGLVENWGYDWPMELPTASLEDMNRQDVLYVDVKAHRNGPKVWERWPHLQGKTLWYRINGTKPEHVPGKGDEVNPPCPVLTPDLWYREAGPWIRKAYACWPPFHRFDEYYPRHGRLGVGGVLDSPMCLIHNLQGWGYGALVEPFRAMGIKMYGVSSPDGLVRHAKIPLMLGACKAVVHLKSSDAPGYALYEALAAACPVVVTRRLIWRNKMHELFVPGETCLVFDRETHDGLSPDDVVECTREVKEALERLSDPAENRRIGLAGRERLKKLMWSADNPIDVESLERFFRRQFS